MPLTANSILSRIEPLIYGPRGRPLCVWLLALMTVLMLVQAARIAPDASFEKSVPLGHPYMEVFQQYQAEFGGGNTLLVALIRNDGGDIYDAGFLARLRSATDQVFFAPGIDRPRVSSIFTRNVRFIEVVDGGFSAGDVIPANYTPSPEMFAAIRTNVGKANVIGRLVTSDQKGAMVRAEVLEHVGVPGAVCGDEGIGRRRALGILESEAASKFDVPDQTDADVPQVYSA